MLMRNKIIHSSITIHDWDNANIKHVWKFLAAQIVSVQRHFEHAFLDILPVAQIFIIIFHGNVLEYVSVIFHDSAQP